MGKGPENNENNGKRKAARPPEHICIIFIISQRIIIIPANIFSPLLLYKLFGNILFIKGNCFKE